jgi:hypothetical protein
VSLLRNIWRPNDPPQKGSGSPAESVLTERLAELLGRESNEERELPSPTPAEHPPAAASLTSTDVGADVATAAPPDEVVSLEPVRSSPPPPPPRRPASTLLSRPPGSTSVSMPSASGVSSITRATDQALEQLRSAEQQIEAELRNRVQEYERTLEAAALAITERGTESEKPLEEAANRFRTEAREWFEGARRELRDQLEASRTSLEAELKRNYQDLIETARQKIESMAQASLEAGAQSSSSIAADREQITQWLKEQDEASRRQTESGARDLAAAIEQALGRLHEAEEEIKGTLRTNVEEYRQASAQSSSSIAAEREQITQWVKEQAEASRRQSESGARELAAAVEQAMGRLRDAEQKMEGAFRSQVDEYRRAVETAAAELERKGITQAKFQNAALELQQATEKILERSTKRIDERAQQAVSTLGDKLAAAQQSLDGAARASLDKALEEQRERWTQALQEQSRAAAESVAQAAEAGQKQLAAARQTAEAGFQDAAAEHARKLVEMAAADLKSGGIGQGLVAETSAQIEQAAKDSLSRSAKDLDQQKEAALSNVSASLDQASRKFIEDVERRLDAAGKAWFDSAGQSVQEQSRARLAAWLEEQTKIAHRQSEAASQAVSQMAEQAKSRLEAIARETEATFRGRAEEQQRAWVGAALESARASGLEQKVVDRAIGELEKSAAAFLEQSAGKLAQQAENSKKAIAAEMDQAAKKMLEGVESALESISWQHRGRLAQWWEERQQAAKREAETNTQSIARAAEQATGQLKTAQSEIEMELKSRSREHQLRLLDSVMEELRGSGAIDRVVTEATSTLRTNTNDLLSRSGEQLRDQVEASRLALDNQAQASRRGLAEELARMAEQAQASVETAGKAVTEDYRRQLSVWWEERTQSARKESEEAAGGINRSARQAADQLQGMRKEMENELRVGLENYRKGLRDAAAEEIRRQGFQKEALETITTELDQTASELAARSTRELKQHIDSALSGLDDKVKTTRQNFLDETQKKLAELTKSSLDTAGNRFHDFLVKNVSELEREQEDWLQRKRETIWLDINKASASPVHAHNAPLQRTLLREGSAETKKEKPGTGWLSWVLGVLAVVAMAAALTAVFVRMAPQKIITMQLHSEPPAGWVVTNPAWGAKRRARELQLANAYWLIAVNSLQHEFAFNTPLPENPPPEFKVDTANLKDDSATRTHYWDEMRNVWTKPDTWQQTVTNGGGPAAKAIEWLRQKFFTAADKTAQSSGT